MTNHHLPPTTVHLGEPGALLASLPALLGFHPEHSLILLCLEGQPVSTIALVARVDLPEGRNPAGVHAAIHQLSRLCGPRRTPAAVAVVVEDTATPAACRGLVRALRAACLEMGTDVIAAHHLPSTVPGVVWSTYGTTNTGYLPDPRSSPVATEHVLRGRVIHGSRAEVDALLNPERPARIAEVGAALVLRRARVEHARLMDPNGWMDPAGTAVRRLKRVLAAVAQVHERTTDSLAAVDVAALGMALADVRVRDTCFGLAAGDSADAAERLWTLLARALPAPLRAEPAVLLAQSAYARGEGPVAGMALRVALEAHPGHRMATLLNASLLAGLPPKTIRSLSATAHGMATALGVPLAPSAWV